MFDLTKLEPLANAIDKDAQRATALAVIALGLRHERPEKARELARSAVALARSDEASTVDYKARALAVAGAALQSIDGEGEGLFLEAHELLRVQLVDRGSKYPHEMQALARVLEAIAISGTSAPMRALVLETLRALPPTWRGFTLYEARNALAPAGLEEQAKEMLRELLGRDDLYLVHLYLVVETLRTLGALVPGDAGRLGEILRQGKDDGWYDLLNPSVLLAALRLDPRSPLEVARELFAELAPFRGVTVLRCLLERGERAQARAVFDSLLNTAFSTDVKLIDLERTWLVAGLLKLVPDLGPASEGLAIVDAVEEGVRRAGQPPLVEVGTLAHCASTLGAMRSDREGALRLLERVLERGLELLGGGEPWKLGYGFEVLEEIASSLVKLEAGSRGLALLRDRIVVRAEARVAESKPIGGHFFAIRTLLRCSRAAHALSDDELARSLMGRALSHMEGKFGNDLIELLEVALEIAAAFPAPESDSWIARVVSLAASARATTLGDYYRYYAIESIERLVRPFELSR